MAAVMGIVGRRHSSMGAERTSSMRGCLRATQVEAGLTVIHDHSATSIGYEKYTCANMKNLKSVLVANRGEIAVSRAIPDSQH